LVKNKKFKNRASIEKLTLALASAEAFFDLLNFRERGSEGGLNKILIDYSGIINNLV
jgi:hypothetical protein